MHPSTEKWNLTWDHFGLIISCSMNNNIDDVDDDCIAVSLEYGLLRIVYCVDPKFYCMFAIIFVYLFHKTI